MNKREQIILAAMHLFVEKGIQGTPMSAIAKAAGTGMGTIYNYFPTKEELINAIYLHIKTSEILQTLESLDKNSSLKTRFLEFYISIINFYLKYPMGFAFMDQMQNSPIITACTKAQGKHAFVTVFELIEQGQKEGIIKNLEMESIIYFLAGTINTFVRWILNEPKNTRKKKIEAQLQMVWDAVKA
ncbi:MAG: hypothetical protein BGO31_19030 [Bacteroidetes bacterium 43-16]|nr:MAG: hypothetical protein BGO31_19030 [Bacteroidetes bacterium 43-16]